MDMKLTKTQDSVLNGLLRHILTAAGGALVARGSLAESELDLAVGAIITLAGVIWSAIATREKRSRNYWLHCLPLAKIANSLDRLAGTLTQINARAAKARASKRREGQGR